MKRLPHEFRSAVRLLANRPLVGFATVGTLAVGIAGLGVVLAMVGHLLLRPLPFLGSERLMLVWESHPRQGDGWQVASLPNALDWREQIDELEQVEASRPWRPIVARDDHFEGVEGAKVSAGFFDLLGLRAARGRLFEAADDRPGAPPVVVLTDRLWRSRFASDPKIVGRRIELDDEGEAVFAEVIGVLPPHPTIPRPLVFQEAQIFSPLAVNSLAQPRGWRMYRVIARRSPETTDEQVRQRLVALAGDLARQHPLTNDSWGARAQSISEVLAAPVRPALLALLAAVSFLYLIAVTNVAVLQRGRRSGQDRDLGVRLALGAGAWSVGRQAFIEALLLTLSAWLLGLGLAWGMIGLVGSLGADIAPRWSGVTLDGSAVFLTAGLAVLTALLLGIFQGLRSLRHDLGAVLRGGRCPGGGPKLRRLLVLEVTWSLVLLMAAGLMLRSFQELMRVDPGFDSTRVLTLRVEAPPSLRAGSSDSEPFMDLLERLQAVPGVESAALADHLPMQGTARSTSAQPFGEGPESGHRVELRGVSTGFVTSLRIPLEAGRDLGAHGAEREVLLNESAVARLWPGVSAAEVIGRELDLAWGDGRSRRVVGVVGDVLHHDLRQDSARPAVYLPFEQTTRRAVAVVVRSELPEKALVGDLSAWSRQRGDVLVIDQIQPLRQVVDRTAARPRAYALLLSAFASLSLLLTAGGIYGVVSFLVSERRADYGVRLALGAGPQDLLRLTLVEGLGDGLKGILYGWVGSLLLARLLSGLFFGVSMGDPWALLGTATLMLTVVALASWLPAMRAMRVDPAMVLRQA